MIGNVPEWCRNPYCDDAYKEKERKDNSRGESNVYAVRGGGWGMRAEDGRCACRLRGAAHQIPSSSIGFRVLVEDIDIPSSGVVKAVILKGDKNEKELSSNKFSSKRQIDKTSLKDYRDVIIVILVLAVLVMGFMLVRNKKNNRAQNSD
jgi:hypothetical protein